MIHQCTPAYYVLQVNQVVQGELISARENISRIMLEGYVGNILLEVAQSMDRALLSTSGQVLPSRQWTCTPSEETTCMEQDEADLRHYHNTDLSFRLGDVEASQYHRQEWEQGLTVDEVLTEVARVLPKDFV